MDEEKELARDAFCEDCSASEGGCKHTIAFLLWIHRVTENPSPTEVECYWKKPALSAVGSSVKYVKSSDLYKKEKSVVEMPNNVNFFKNVISIAKDKQLDSQISRYSFDICTRNLYNLSIHQLLLNFFEEQKPDSYTADIFLQYAKSKLTNELCVNAELQTRLQSESLLWHELRFGRITASKIYEAAQCKTNDGSLVNQIIGISKKYDNIFMERGRNLESQVIHEVRKSIGVKIKKCGLILSSKYPMFGATPDGITDDFVIEVKCPAKKSTLQNYFTEGKITDKCKAQIMFQMLAAKKSKGLFCVADPNFETNKLVEQVWVDLDESFINPIMEKASKFWINNIYNKLSKVRTVC